MTVGVKGRFTFRFSAACFALSAVFELLSLQEDVFLLGNIVGGIGAAIYHIIYAALFGWLTIGLWRATPSGYYSLLATSAIYTLDRAQVLLVGDALGTSLRQQVAEHPEVLQVTSVEDLVRVVSLTMLAMVTCWWGFVAYAYYRREYFGIHRVSN